MTETADRPAIVSRADAIARLEAAAIPEPIVKVAERLQSQGHAAVLVGGAVRDVLLGRGGGDWDLATSATPQEVQALFRKTIPTGLEHGTVTVLVRLPNEEKGVPVEVTTFRGEGAYLDGRRPSSVTFLRDLHEDLARRDFTVNALAWDPVARHFEDPFDGLGDLQRQRIRAVGDPYARFAEDGLRTMRAVRFCATLGFTLDPPTALAIAPALPVLDKVSRERVRIELIKLLCAPQPSLGLLPMRQTGMWGHVLPLLQGDEATAAIAAVDAMPPDPIVRLSRLLWPIASRVGGTAIETAVENLKPSNQERARVLALTGRGAAELERAPQDDAVAIRRATATLGREHLEDAIALLGFAPDRAAAVRRAVEGAALCTGELAVKGRDLITEGIVKPGPQLGTLLQSLLQRVIEEPALNDRDRLLAIARTLAP